MLESMTSTQYDLSSKNAALIRATSGIGDEIFNPGLRHQRSLKASARSLEGPKPGALRRYHETDPNARRERAEWNSILETNLNDALCDRISIIDTLPNQ
jgi:hypothetical protein